MIIHCLSSTYSSHGVLTSRLQICASILLTDVSQPTQYHHQKQHRFQRLSNHDRRRYVHGAIQHIGSLQSPFNPHTHTAPAG
jgi:hypothetical protein